MSGKKNGSGIILYPNGDKYKGKWKNGKKHGKGVTIIKNGIEFETEWLDGKLVEKKLLLIEKNMESEKYKKDTTIIYTNGDKYIGKWEQGRLIWKLVENHDGNGLTISIDGSEFETEWIVEKLPEQKLIPVITNENSEKDTKDTTIIYSNGDKYIGHWQDGKSNGPGTMIYPNGDKYEGEWKNGKKHGKGVTISKDGNKVEEGAYKSGEKDG